MAAPSAPASTPSARGAGALPKTYSLEDLLIETSPHVSEVAKHNVREKPALRRWDSGEYYASPAEVRGRLDSNEEDPFQFAAAPSTPGSVPPAGAPWPLSLIHI